MDVPPGAPNAGFLSGPPTEAPKTVLGPSFFAEFKKSEISELRDVLAKAIKFKRDDEITDALKKIVEAMTHGLNVQDLCETIVQVSHSRILVQKKMVYLYLNFHAQQVPAMAMMSVNSMVRDARDDDPTIRGLALRWLCSLGVPDLVQHIVPVVRELLKDKSPYARRNATLGCGKLFHLAPDIFSDGEVLGDLYTLIRDRDPQVVVNSLASLDEILRSSGGMQINQKIILHLVSHLQEFNEWGQLYVLRFMQQKYTPADEDELFAIMNLLDFGFQHMNSSVVLATVHLFLHYSQSYPEIYSSVFERIKEPMLCLLITAPPEIEYSTLKHILLVSKRAPNLFENDYKLFYLKPFSDPEYNKITKVTVLNYIATDKTVLEIIEELAFYITDDDIPVANESIRVICRLAVRLPDAAPFALSLLLSFLEFEQLLHVMETTVDVLKDMLRRFPSHAPEVMPQLAKAIDIVKCPEAVAAVISMIGEHGKYLDRAPYILEDCIKTWDPQAQPQTLGAKVKNQLLVATLKLFFKRPFEMKPILSQLFATAIEDFSNPDVHDKAIFYYRLLSSSVETCAAVVNSSKLSIENNFSEDQDAALVDSLFEEFNSLSVVFQLPSSQYLKFEEVDLEDKPEAEEQQ